MQKKNKLQKSSIENIIKELKEFLKSDYSKSSKRIINSALQELKRIYFVEY